MCGSGYDLYVSILVFSLLYERLIMLILTLSSIYGLY